VIQEENIIIKKNKLNFLKQFKENKILIFIEGLNSNHKNYFFQEIKFKFKKLLSSILIGFSAFLFCE
jgi:hypothetical protein